MRHPDHVLARLLASGLAVAASLAAGSVLLVLLGGTSSLGGGWSLWCLIAPVSSFDIAIHSAALGLWLLGGIAGLAAVRTVNWHRAQASELRGAARLARTPALTASIQDVAARVGVADCLDLIEVERPFGFVYGWVRPRICLSTGMTARLTERELEAVLHHERWHLVRRDPARLLAAQIIATAFGSIPLFRRLAAEHQLASEIAADHYVVTVMGGRAWLAAALAKSLADADNETIAAPAFTSQIEARIAALADESFPPAPGVGRFTVVSVGLQAALLVLVVGGVAFPSTFWPHPLC